MAREFPTTARAIEAAVQAYHSTEATMSRTAETTAAEFGRCLMDAAVQRFLEVEGYNGEGRGNYFGRGEPREVRVVGPWRMNQ
jgi:hypothetical protein